MIDLVSLSRWGLCAGLAGVTIGTVMGVAISVSLAIYTAHRQLGRWHDDDVC